MRHARRTPVSLAPSAGLAETLINAMEAKNAYLRGHSQRVAELAASVAEALGLDPDVVEQVRLAGRLHDVGKIGVREAVLDKPGPLDPDEYAHVREHVRIGLEILAPMPGLGPVLAFIGDHHERIDGSGYPRGVAGEAISIGGRIIAAADTFDALTSRRAYRDARSEQDTVAFMAGLVGRSLFPDVFDALRRTIEQRQALVFLGDLRAPGAHPDDWRRADSSQVAATGPAFRAVVSGIAALPRAERLALTLHHLEGLSDEEIGEALGASPTSAARLRGDAARRIARLGLGS
jgi:putative nucleotidyltransferase with HDIG domain